MAIDIEKIRNDFPFFKAQPTLHYLDSAATALKPQCVIDAMNEYNLAYSTNVHRGLYPLSERATAAYEGARETVANFINARSSKEIIFTSGTTHSINLVALGWARSILKKDDEIVVTTLEHHSNLVPWQMLGKELGVKIVYWDPRKDGTLDPTDANKYFNRRTRLLAITHISNALGTLMPLKQCIQKAYACGVRVLVDAAQSASRIPIDVQYLDCDFLAFSGHKLYGPTGIGILYVKEKHFDSFRPVFGGGGMIREVTKTHTTWNDPPWKFEAGTPPIAEAIGLARAIRYVREIGLSAIHGHEKSLTNYALEKLSAIKNIRILGPAKINEHESIISFIMNNIHGHDIASIVGENEIAIRAGHHCCMPLMQFLNVPATARISFGIYNTQDDVEALIKGLRVVQKVFNI